MSPLRDFYTGLGDNYRNLRPNELADPRFPARIVCRLSRGVYRKLRVRGSIDYPLAGVAVAMKRIERPHRRCAHRHHRGEPGPAAGEQEHRSCWREKQSMKPWPKPPVTWPRKSANR